ncbi:FMN-dependent NADH-azoreductase [Oricola cellulosilytica]|uniref:FMN dependent NADH:quinone oxidoreductase n=1 Tax=Oricola cellulosilytica TaxID=1429082 RepID=A0A4R0PCT0_9HYPH|nr:NAD(P)H-dependent oxidoreductase [Oricola cellulosilytica]TCD14343.1 FMN-dependent NADH-azoreductase [Oricola cellulosilytica]
MTKILSVQASARAAGSFSRRLSADLVDTLRAVYGDAEITEREATAALPLIDEHWLSANWTPKADRTVEQAKALALSEQLVTELKEADILVVGAPIYNFSIPGSLKAWIDLVCRAGETFRYTDAGPEGLLSGKKAYIVVTSGGVPVDSVVDFATPHLRQVLNFIGIDDVEIVAADGLVNSEDESLAKANEAIRRIADKETASAKNAFAA